MGRPTAHTTFKPLFLALTLAACFVPAAAQEKGKDSRPGPLTSPLAGERQEEDERDAAASWAYATRRGRVVDVISGNTITVLSGKKKFRVGLLGLGVPEKGLPFADKSRDNLSRLLKGKNVEVLAIPGGAEGGGDSPLAGKVLLEGADAGLEQIRGGFGWLSDESENYQTRRDRRLYAEAERAAAEKRLGLWGEDYKCKDDSVPTTTNPSPVVKSGEAKARVSGTVHVKVLIDESGKVISAEALCGHPLLRQTAVKASYIARFSQTLVSGSPVKVAAVMTFTFVAEQ